MTQNPKAQGAETHPCSFWEFLRPKGAPQNVENRASEVVGPVSTWRDAAVTRGHPY